MMKRILSVLICVLLITFAFAGCASKEEPAGGDNSGQAAALTGKDIATEDVKIAFIPISTAGITNQIYNVAIAEAISMYPNVVINVFDGQYDVTVINNIIQECITQAYDAIIFESLDTEASNGAVTDAENAGIPVLSLNGGAPSALHSYHIQGADYEMGQQGAQYLAEACGNKGNAIILDAPSGSVSAARMGTGAKEYFEQKTEMTIIDHQYIDKWSIDNAVTTMSDLLTKHSDIQVVYCASDDIALGACQAIEAANRQNDGILVWGGTGYPSAFEAIKEGRMYGTSWCDTYSEMCTTIYTALFMIDAGMTSVKCGFTETPIVKQAMIAVTGDNVDSIYDISRWNYDSAYIG